MRTGVLVAIAVGLMGLGLMLGLSTSSAMGATATFSCGSPWDPNTKEMDHQSYIDDLANSLAGSSIFTSDYRERCDDAFGSRGVFAWLSLGAGALLLGGLAVVRRPQPSVPQAPSESEPVDNA